MANYKKKQVGAHKGSKNTSKRKYSDEYEFIEFSKPKAPERKKQSANKKKNQLPKKSSRLFVGFIFAFVLIITYAVVCLLHPVGIVEYISSVYTSFGSSGRYNIELEGGQVQNVISAGNKNFVLTNTMLSCYNKSGKTVFQTTHNYSNPVIKVGDTRYILYEQGEKEISLCTLNKIVYKQSFDKGVICAAVSHSGGYAVATKADGYDSSVSVFNKNNKKIYEWFSSDETVNAVALSKNGKRLAVSTIKVESGKFVSSIYVFKFNSANPILKLNYTDDVVYDLRAVSGSYFCAVFKDNVQFINYKSEKVKDNLSEYYVSIVKQFSNRVIAIRTVAANQDESLAEIYTTSGKLISSFKVNSYVTDFSYKSGSLYILGLSEVFQYNNDGKLLRREGVGYDTNFIDAISSNKVACVRSSVIEKTTISNAEE